MGKPIYSRLTRRRRTLFGYSQLWLGRSHILLVESTHYTENYRRFALKDIQAIVVTTLPPRTVVQVVFLTGAVLVTLGVFFVDSIVTKGLIGFAGLVAVITVVVDIARGQHCRCYLQTAVSRELLVPVSRMRQARRLLGLLQPPMDAVQGVLTEEDAGQAVAPSIPAVEPPPHVQRSLGHVPEILFALCLLDAVLVWVDRNYPGLQFSNLLLTTFVGEVILAVVSLIRKGSRAPLVTILVVLSFLCAGWDFVGIVQRFASTIGELAESARMGRPAVAVNFSWSPSPGQALFAILWRFIAGFTGLIAIYIDRRAEARG